MSDPLTRLFDSFDRGNIDRRQLLQALGIAAVGVPFANSFGQGSCKGTPRDSTPACIKVLKPAPFKPTGWKTVLLDSFSMQVVDPEKEAAYYAALMGWKVRSNDATGVMMDIGDWGAVKIRPGYVRPAPPAPPAGAAAGGAAGAAAGGAGGAGRGGAAGGGGRGGAAGGDTTAAGRGNRGGGNRGAAGADTGAAARGARGGGGGGGGGGRANANCATSMPTNAGGVIWDGFAFGIAPWDDKKVEAALKERGLNPVKDFGGDFKSYHVIDPDGLDLQITNGNKKNRRTKAPNGKLKVDLPFAPTGWKTLYLDHISFAARDYKASVAFYEALIGWKGLDDEGSQNETQIAPEIGGLLIRGNNSLAPVDTTAGRGGRGGGRGGARGPVQPVSVDKHVVMNHISFGIADFDPDKVSAALCARGLSQRADTGATGDIHVTEYKSYHTTTPHGFDLQISNTITPPK